MVAMLAIRPHEFGPPEKPVWEELADRLEEAVRGRLIPAAGRWLDP